jgi:hypothetical protein
VSRRKAQLQGVYGGSSICDIANWKINTRSAEAAGVYVSIAGRRNSLGVRRRYRHSQQKQYKESGEGAVLICEHSGGQLRVWRGVLLLKHSKQKQYYGVQV